MMLSREDNELLCRVGPGTGMGTYMRRFWIPAVRSKLLQSDGAPERVRLLGQDFVAFRDTGGRVGFLHEACPHRGVSLALARNEECGLRCLYHGWKFNTDGKAVDIPTERPESRAKFAARVPSRGHPVREAGGLVWAYLGNPAEIPAFPQFNWLDLPDNQIHCARAIVGVNWLSGLESQLDTSHVGILHRDLAPDASSNVDKMMLDASPRFEFDLTSYGYREAAIRNMPDGALYVRIREFVLPWFSFIPTGGRDVTQAVTISVPIDDEHSAQWDVVYNLTRPLHEGDVFGDELERPDNYLRDVGSIANRFGQDRAEMKSGSWTGFNGVRLEDFAVNLSQGAIPDRSREFLGSADASIVKARRILLDKVKRAAARTLAADEEVRWGDIRAIGAVIPADADWRSLPR
jgi:phthalate 4,5-dioxygenase